MLTVLRRLLAIASRMLRSVLTLPMMVKGHLNRWSGFVFNRKTLSSITDAEHCEYEGFNRVSRRRFLHRHRYDMRILGSAAPRFHPRFSDKAPDARTNLQRTLAKVAAQRPKWVFQRVCSSTSRRVILTSISSIYPASFVRRDRLDKISHRSKSRRAHRRRGYTVWIR